MKSSLQATQGFLAAIFDTNSALVFVRNENNKPVYANTAAQRFVGDQTLERGLSNLHENLHSSSAEARTTQLQCVSINDKPGHQRYFGFSSQPIHVNNVCEHHVLEIFYDVTELQSANIQLKQQHQDLVQKIQSMTKLNTVAIDMISGLDLQSVLQHVANNTASLTHADYAYIAMVHQSGDYLETMAAGNDSLNLKSIKHVKGEGIGGEAWKSGSTVCVPDYPNYPKRLRGLTSAKQACGIPMIVNGNVIGVIGIMYESYDIDIYSQLDIVENFAKLAAIAVENAKLHETTRAELARTEAIGELSRDIYGATEFDTLLDRICVTLVGVFDAQKAHLYRLDASQQLVPLMAWENKDGEVVPTIQANSKLVNQSIARWCVQEQKTGYIPRGVEDERDSPAVHRIRKLWDLGSTVCIPLVHEKKTWGILFTHRSSAQQNFTKNEINLIQVIANQTSVAIHRHELMDKMHHQAYHDSLTGLPNRFSFENTLVTAIASAEAQKRTLVLMFIDLDGFKTINDSLGHSTGDKLLKSVATRFRSCLQDADVLARMGGDEFAILLHSISDRSEAQKKAQCLIDSLQRKVIINEMDIKVSASIGISQFPDDSTNASGLLKYADIAMYTAKQADKIKISMFSPAHAKRFEERIRMELDLKIALEEKQFELHLQPKVTYHSGKVNGVEALARWKHPALGYIPPFKFIPVAEECGLILELGDWVLDESCRLVQELFSQGIDVSIAVNISAHQFSQPGFVNLILDTLKKYDLPATKLELEVTESVLMKHVDTVINRLAILRRRGIKIAIDDFGTGYSSLQYLEDLPLDILKIDKAFVDKLNTVQADNSLVNIIVLMAKAYNLETVVEGVEHVEQLDKVIALGCDHIQGYLYSPPVPVDELAQVIENIESEFTAERQLKKAS